MEYGIVLHAAGILSIGQAMDEIAGAGFRHFEYSHGHVKSCETSGKDAFDEAADNASGLGLKPAQLHGPSLEPGFDLGSPDPGVRKRCVERSSLWVEHCSRLGVPVMVEHGCEFHQDFAATMRHMEESLKSIGKACSDHGVELAIENEYDPRPLAAPSGGREMVIPARVGCLVSELLEAIVNTDPENLGICLDLGHAHMQRPLFEIADAIREAGDRLLATHLHDNEGLQDQHLVPMMGSIPWGPAMAALREIRYDRPLILEVGGLSHRDDVVRTNRLRLCRALARELCED
jgi:sugar phosphate isomerase/epimerase